MANKILIKRKTTSGNPLPASLDTGEMCYVLPDKNLFIKNSDGSISLINSTKPVVNSQIDLITDYFDFFNGNYLTLSKIPIDKTSIRILNNGSELNESTESVTRDYRIDGATIIFSNYLFNSNLKITYK